MENIIKEISQLVDEYWDKTEKLCLNIPSSDRKKEKIETIGTYYRCIAKGGAQRVVVQLIRIWKSMGYNVVLFTDEEATENDYLIPNDVNRIILQPKAITNKTNYKYRMVQLLDAIDKYNIDLMIYHDWESPLLLWDMLTCYAVKTQFVIYCHSIFSNLIRGQKTRLLKANKVFGKADAVITLNDMDQQYWSNYNDKVVQVVNPIYFEWKKIAPKRKYNKKILWMGRLVDDKNPIDVLYMMKSLIVQDPEIVLYMLGDSVRPAYTDQIIQIIQKLHLESNVIMEPFCKDVTPYLEECSIYLMTSKIESFSLTLQETQCYGMPCVMYELPYLTLTKNKRGIVEVQQGNIEQAVQEILKIAESAERYQSLGEGARANIEELYDGHSLEQTWQHIFSSLLKNTEAISLNGATRFVMEEIVNSYERRLERESEKKNLPKCVYANIMARDIVIFGTGRKCQSIKREYPNLRVKFYLDNNRERCGDSIYDCEIKHPDQITDWKTMFIIIAIVDYGSIKKQLEEKGLKYGEDFVLQQDIFEV